MTINRIFNIINPFDTRKSMPSLVRLNRLALKKIFDSLTYDEEKELEYGIEVWPKEVIPRLMPTAQKIAKDGLKIIVNALIENEEGLFDREKDDFKRCEIDYRKAYREGL